MKYCINTKICIFSRFTEEIFALSSQEYKISKNGKCVCPKKFINETKNSYPLRITFENIELSIYDVVLQKNIIYLYFKTNNPDSIILDKIYKDKKLAVFTCGNNKKPECNIYVPSEQECSLLTGDGGNYSTKIEINKQPLMVILDTGSATLGVPTDPYIEIKPKDTYGDPLPTYKPAKDKCVKTTDFLSYLRYDTGSWGGSNLISKIEVGNKKLNYMQFGAGYFDPNTQSQIYQGGIMGLSFTYNNKYKIDFGKTSYPPTKEMLTQEFWDEENKKQKTTYPTFMDYYGQKYSSYSQKFAFWVQRCLVSNTKNKEKAQKEETNFGKFILGSGESYTNLYKGELSTIPVIKTPFKNPVFVYYTIQLNNFKINNENINIPKKYFTYIDSGTTVLLFPKYFYEQIKNIFTSINIPLNCDGTGNFWDKYTFKYISDQNSKPIDKNYVCLKYWPTLQFPLTDKDGNTKILKISPHNYWNIQNGKYYFIINFGEPRIILGLPFLCENYCVFDYGQKQVKIAPRK